MICRYKIKFISDIEQKIRKLLVNIAVAPFVGVWIEMNRIFITSFVLMSLPSWECGLKFCIELSFSKKQRSLPSWECGLKLYPASKHGKTAYVAPFVGVWIEISKMSAFYQLSAVAPFVGVWIEIAMCPDFFKKRERRSLRGSVD